MSDKTYPAAAIFMLSSRYDLRCVEFVVDFMGSKLSKKIYDDSIHEVKIKKLQSDSGLFNELRELLCAERLKEFLTVPEDKRVGKGYYDEGFHVDCEIAFEGGKAVNYTLRRIYKDDPFNEAYRLLQDRLGSKISR